jgi:hypothetical protein
MNIYIPVGKKEHLCTFLNKSFDSLIDYKLIIHYEKGCEKLHRQDYNRQKAIHENKLKLLKIAMRRESEYFMMMDSDIVYYNGIQKMIDFLDKNKDYGAVSLWPHREKMSNPESRHICSDFIMIRPKMNLNLYNFEYVHRKCWCNVLGDAIRKAGYLLRQLETGKIIHLSEQ